jgi:hypothetical protein
VGEGFDRDPGGLGAKLVGALKARQKRFEVAETIAGLKKQVRELKRENDSLYKKVKIRDSEIASYSQQLAGRKAKYSRSEERKRIDHLEEAIGGALELFRNDVRAKKGKLDTPWKVLIVQHLMRGLAPATNWFSNESRRRVTKGEF